MALISRTAKRMYLQNISHFSEILPSTKSHLLECLHSKKSFWIAFSFVPISILTAFTIRCRPQFLYWGGTNHNYHLNLHMQSRQGSSTTRVLSAGKFTTCQRLKAGPVYTLNPPSVSVLPVTTVRIVLTNCTANITKICRLIVLERWF